MLFLSSAGEVTLRRYEHPHLGRLVQPRTRELSRLGSRPWGADNDCFQGLDREAWLTMLDNIPTTDRCLFVLVPDKVGSHAETLELWMEHRGEVSSRGFPLGFVAQDGCDYIPPDADALFIGGTDDFKLGPTVDPLIAEAKRRGMWVHMGRVNSRKRIRYAKALGCDSVDGTSVEMFRDTYLAAFLEECAAPTQGVLW